MPSIRKIDHIAIVTKSLSQSLEFFEKNLGISCNKIEDLPQRGIRVAFLPIGDTRIELIESISNPSEVSSFLEKRGPGIHHIAFECADIQNDVEQLNLDGIQLTSKDVSTGAHGAKVAFIHPKSSHGVLIELTKPSES